MLHPTTVQLHIADLQDSIVELSRTNPAADLRRAARALVAAADLLEIPVTLSAAPRPGGPDVIEEVAAAGPIFVRSGPCAWDDPAVHSAVTAHDRRVLALCGVASEVVVLHTALAALAGGYEVRVLIDATGGLADRTEKAALSQISAAGGQITSVASFVTDMIRDFTTPVGRDVLSTLRPILLPAT
jgi:nicotinamidase-related amidase